MERVLSQNVPVGDLFIFNNNLYRCIEHADIGTICKAFKGNAVLEVVATNLAVDLLDENETDAFNCLVKVKGSILDTIARSFIFIGNNTQMGRPYE